MSDVLLYQQSNGELAFINAPDNGDGTQSLAMAAVDVGAAVDDAILVPQPTGSWTKLRTVRDAQNVHTVVTTAALIGVTFTPAMFGARGDGVTDDTDAFQTMWDSILLNNGAIIDFGTRTYRVTKQSVLNKPNIVLLMGNAKILIDNQYDGFLVLNRAAHNVFIDRPNIRGIQERNGNPRSYYIAQGINQWYGTAGYAKASAILATDVKNLTIWRPVIENVFYCINIAGWNIGGGIATDCRIESPILIDTDFGILAANQLNLAITGYIYGRHITKTTADDTLIPPFEGLEPHLIYCTIGIVATPQLGVFIGDVFCEDNVWDSAVKIKNCPGIVISSVRAKTHNIIIQVSESPNGYIGPLTGEDMYRSLSSTWFPVALLDNDGLTIESIDVQIRTGENVVGCLRFSQNDTNCRIGSVNVRSNVGALTPTSIVQFEAGSNNNVVESVSWTDPGAGVANRSVIVAVDSDGNRINSVTTRGNFSRIMQLNGTSSNNIVNVGAGKLDVYDLNGFGFRELGTGTGNAIYWSGGSKNVRQINADFTVKGADNNGRLRVFSPDVALTVTFSAELKIGMEGEIIQYGAGNINLVTEAGVARRGLSGLTAINTVAKWRMIASNILLITAG